MFLPIKVILDRRPRKDGTAVISIQYCFSSDKRTLLFTGQAVPPRYWNKRLLRISPDLSVEHGQAEALNGRLQKMIRVAEDIVMYALDQKIEDPATFLKKKWSPELDTLESEEREKLLARSEAEESATNLDFFYQLDDYMKAKSRKVSTGMMRTYKVMKNRLLILLLARNKSDTDGLKCAYKAIEILEITTSINGITRSMIKF